MGLSLAFLELKLQRKGRRARAKKIVLFIHDVHGGSNGVLRLGAGEGYEVHVAATPFQRLGGVDRVHDSPDDFLDQVEAYPGSIGGLLNGLYKLTIIFSRVGTDSVQLVRGLA